MQTSESRRSAVVEESGDAALSQLSKVVKAGAKGPGVPAFAQRLGIPFPAKLYDTVIADGALIARVGGDELIIEAEPGNALLAKFEQGLTANEPGVYRIEQQSLTFVLTGDKGHRMLLQTCGVEMDQEPIGRIVYSRVAGVSCGMIPQQTGAERSYRLWCDYTLAPYLWENLHTILSELH